MKQSLLLGVGLVLLIAATNELGRELKEEGDAAEPVRGNP